MTKEDKIFFIVFAIIFIALVIFGIDRFKDIDNGDMKVVSQTEMAERK